MTKAAPQRLHADVDLTDPELYRKGFPHEVFATLRREKPVCWQTIPDGFPGSHDEGFWVLSRHDDVQAANRDAELFSSLDGPTLSHQPEMSGAMLVAILLTITPFVFPIVMSTLGLLTGMVQAYIFSILAAVYIAAATRTRPKEI